MRLINATGLSVLRHFESLRLTAYQDEAGVWTIGWGHTGPEVYEGLVITEAQADQFLENDLTEAEDCVDLLCPMGISDNHFAALVLFAYNVGCNAFQHSTLLKCMVMGDLVGAANEFAKWHHAGGHDSKGLMRRRAAEANLFATEDTA